MQELMTYAGQLDCYQQSGDILAKFLNVEVSVMQVHRVTDTYGGLLEREAQDNIQEEPTFETKAGECLYTMIDGSMLLTREDGYSEVKLGRLFKESDLLEVSGERGWISHSVYEAYLGESKTFCHRLEQKLDGYRSLKEKLVFLTDGALWIKNWITDAYPQATHILDWYHAVEYLGEFAAVYFEDQRAKNHWIEQQKTLLYESCTEAVIEGIRALPTEKQSIQNAQAKLVQYYQGNKDRMDYKRYRSMGAGLIGSGAVESAHRTVVQRRMKLSGQRWSRKRAQHMLALRCKRLSGQWKKVINLICSQKIAA